MQHLPYNKKPKSKAYKRKKVNSTQVKKPSLVIRLPNTQATTGTKRGIEQSIINMPHLHQLKSCVNLCSSGGIKPSQIPSLYFHN